MGLWDTIKNVHPINPAAQAVGDALTVGQPIQTQPLPQPGQATADAAQKEAVDTGAAALREAVKRGKGE
jgi:hypothetical protein